MSAVRDPGLDGVVPFRFACQRCGHCCSGGSGYVWLAEGEIERLASALDLTPAHFTRVHVRTARDPRSGEQRAALRETANEGGRCTLLLGRNTCGVYAARPAHCRAFPYWPSVLTDRAAFEAARSTCPGIAVEVEAATRASAFAALERLHEDVDAQGVDAQGVDAQNAPASCCLDAQGSERTFATALEADYALADPPRPAGACRLGDRRPVTCRTRAGEAALARVRAIERSHGYPAAYGPLAEMLAARGGER